MGFIQFGVALLWALSAHAEPVVFRSTDSPPYWSAQLPEDGLGGSMLRLISKEAGVSYSIEYQPIKRFSKSNTTYIVGDPDLLSDLKHRAIFPIGLFRSAFFFYTPHHEVIKMRSLKDMKGHTLGVLRGSADVADFIRHGINIEESDSVESLIKKLKKGRIDLCILAEGSGRYEIQKFFPTEQDNFSEINIPSLTRPIAIIIDKQVPEGKMVAQRYRKVMRDALQSPQYRAILKLFYAQEGVPADRDAQMEKFIKHYSNTWDD